MEFKIKLQSKKNLIRFGNVEKVLALLTLFMRFFVAV